MKIYKFLAFDPLLENPNRIEVYIYSDSIKQAESKLGNLGYFSIEFIQEIRVIS